MASLGPVFECATVALEGAGDGTRAMRLREKLLIVQDGIDALVPFEVQLE